MTPHFMQTAYMGTGVLGGSGVIPATRTPPTFGSSVTVPASSPSSLNFGGGVNLAVGSQGPTVGLLLALVGGFVLLYATTLKIQGSR